jgi:fructose-1,6-bisphosphatase/inositol monophosphatase family enzyme
MGGRGIVRRAWQAVARTRRRGTAAMMVAMVVAGSLVAASRPAVSSVTVRYGL